MNIYFNDDEYAHIQEFDRGYVRALVQEDMGKHLEAAQEFEAKKARAAKAKDPLKPLEPFEGTIHKPEHVKTLGEDDWNTRIPGFNQMSSYDRVKAIKEWNQNQ